MSDDGTSAEVDDPEAYEAALLLVVRLACRPIDQKDLLLALGRTGLLPAGLVTLLITEWGLTNF